MHSIINFDSIIQWCNSNVGFATIVLSVLTLLVSIIALIVSINTAKLPYKKLLKIEVGSYFSTGGDKGIHVTAINCGNMDFTIISMGLFTKENQCIFNANGVIQYPVRLKNGERVSEYFSYESPEIQRLISNHTIVAYVKDSEGKVIRKKTRYK